MLHNGFGSTKFFYSTFLKVLEITSVYACPQISWRSEVLWTTMIVLHWQPLPYLMPFLPCSYLPVTICHIYFLQWKKTKTPQVCSAIHETPSQFFAMKNIVEGDDYFRPWLLSFKYNHHAEWNWTHKGTILIYFM